MKFTVEHVHTRYFIISHQARDPPRPDLFPSPRWPEAGGLVQDSGLTGAGVSLLICLPEFPQGVSGLISKGVSNVNACAHMRMQPVNRQCKMKVKTPILSPPVLSFLGKDASQEQL